MTLLAQLDVATNNYFAADNGKAWDNYFQTSFLLDYFIKQHKGVWLRPGSGRTIRVPLRFDGNVGGWYTRGGTLSHEKRDALTATYAEWRHAYGNATILRVDELENAGKEGLLNLMVEELYGAQETVTDKIATALYQTEDNHTTNALTGFGAMCDSDTTLAFQGYAGDDIVSDDGTKVWVGNRNVASTVISLATIRALKATAAFGKGKTRMPNFMATTRDLFNVIVNVLQLQQRFTSTESQPVKAGFEGINFEGTDIFPDDQYAPAGMGLLLNSNHCGVAVHQNGLFKRTPWEYILDTARDKTMKILFDGNTVCNNRRAHVMATALTVS